MPLFHYEAKDINNNLRKGYLEAKDKIDLAKRLHNEGFFLIDAFSDKEKSGEKFVNFSSIREIFGISIKEKLFFFRNLQVMVSAGIALPRSIRTLAEQTKNNKFKKALLQTEENLLKGFSLSQSFSYFPEIFPPLIINMVKVGEESGTLETILANLTEHLEKQNQLKNRIIGALMYPSIIILAMIGIGILMLIIVVPKLAETFEELGIELPITTRIVIFAGYSLLNYWYLILFLLVVVVFLFRRLLKTTGGKDFIDEIVLKIPVLGELLKKYYTVEIIRTLSILMRSGVPILNSLEIAGNVALNKHFKDSLEEAKKEVKKGGSLSAALKKSSEFYSDTTIEMFLVGEETGQTGQILEKLTAFYDDEIAQTTQNLSSIIEPILMIIIGAAIGFFAVAMVQPMYSMLGSI
ncbi:MAG: type II secretion system F family protein [bacterium]|nr:type II secretion system F family protein [bacterium]